MVQQTLERNDKKSSYMVASGSESESFRREVEEERAEGEASTMDDASFEEELEPEFDVIKSLLREAYLEKNGRVKGEGSDVEAEFGEGGKRKFEVGDRGGDVESRKNQVMSSDGDVRDVKRQKKPMFRDLGDMDSILEVLKWDGIFHLQYPQCLRHVGKGKIAPVGGVLLYGPPGCGKTTLARAIANETGLPFYGIKATELVSGITGATEKNIRELFAKAYRSAPSIVFIDEIDVIASKRSDHQKDMETRIVTELMSCMDKSNRLSEESDEDLNKEDSDFNPPHILVLGATNRPDALDPAIRRPGRFDCEIYLGLPDENARLQILKALIQEFKVEGTVDLLKIARSTSGFAGADLKEVVDEAGRLAVKRVCQPHFSSSDDWWRPSPQNLMICDFENHSAIMENLMIIMADFEEAIRKVQPAVKREGFSAIPDVLWEDVGGLDLLRKELDLQIISRIKHPDDDDEDLNLDMQTGFLLYGPPGCGKTLIAKAVANEAGASFIHIQGPELLNKYVGETERRIRELFQSARACSPCIIFIDEIDAIATKRHEENNRVIQGQLLQLLIELNGGDPRQGVFVIAATNRPDTLDPAILRNGRLGEHFYVGLPSAEERGLILKTLARKKPIDPEVDLSAIARMEACENLSGSDLATLMQKAAVIVREQRKKAKMCGDPVPKTIKITHFEQALENFSPALSNKEIQRYNKIFKRFKRFSKSS